MRVIEVRRLNAAATDPRLAVAVARRRALETDPGIIIRDLKNAVRYRSNAPRAHERIWVDPLACATALESDDALGPYSRALSGQVKGGSWDLRVRPIREIEKISFALLHWCDGVPWEETGAYEYMLRMIRQRGRAVDRCRTLDDVVERYAELDRIFDEVRREGRLRTRSELPNRSVKRRRQARLYDRVLGPAVRERKGILVHIGRDVQPIYGGGSHHRVAMAIALELPIVPAHLGRIHRRAIRRWREAFMAGAPAPGPQRT